MKVIVTKDKNVLKLGLIISIIIGIICTIALFTYINEISHFKKVSAEIIDVETRFENRSSTSQSRNKYIRYKYTFKGKDYIGEKLTLLFSKRHIGDIVTIKINPNKPEEIQNNLFIIIYIIAIVVCVIMFLMASTHLFRKKII